MLNQRQEQRFQGTGAEEGCLPSLPGVDAGQSEGLPGGGGIFQKELKEPRKAPSEERRKRIPDRRKTEDSLEGKVDSK